MSIIRASFSRDTLPPPAAARILARPEAEALPVRADPMVAGSSTRLLFLALALALIAIGVTA